jgi:hypothetical protein
MIQPSNLFYLVITSLWETCELLELLAASHAQSLCRAGVELPCSPNSAAEQTSQAVLLHLAEQ